MGFLHMRVLVQNMVKENFSSQVKISHWFTLFCFLCIPTPWLVDLLQIHLKMEKPLLSHWCIWDSCSTFLEIITNFIRSRCFNSLMIHLEWLILKHLKCLLDTTPWLFQISSMKNNLHSPISVFQLFYMVLDSNRKILGQKWSSHRLHKRNKRRTIWEIFH